MKQVRKIVLASSSPSRQALLTQIGLTFTVDPSNYDESQYKGLTPQRLVKVFSQAKAREVAARHSNAVIIAADTVALLGKTVLGKPKDQRDAVRMLKRMSGRKVSSITGFTIIDTHTEKSLSKVTETAVYFRRLTLSEIKQYVATGEPMGKAGAYAIQGRGALLIKKVEGDLYVVMGLPLSALAESLRQLGVVIL